MTNNIVINTKESKVFYSDYLHFSHSTQNNCTYLRGFVFECFVHMLQNFLVFGSHLNAQCSAIFFIFFAIPLNTKYICHGLQTNRDLQQCDDLIYFDTRDDLLLYCVPP